MKKIFLTVFILAVAVFSVYSQTGTIQELTGEVEIKQAGASAFVPAQPGVLVAQDTIISTGFRSTAIVAVGSSVITVRPLTRLTLSEIQSSAGTERLDVNLEAGRIRVEVKPPAGTRANTTIQTPSATASVRGTIVDMDTLNAEMVNGKIIYHGNDGIGVILSEGESSSVQGGAAVDPVVITEENLMPTSPPGVGTAGETITQSAAPSPTPPPAPSTGDVNVGVNWPSR